MRIFIKKRSGKLLSEMNVNPSLGVTEFKSEFYKNHGFYPERQRFTIGTVNGAPLKDGTLSDNGISTDTVLFFKDLGPQISWRLVFVIEYFGPLLIFPLFYFCSKFIYGINVQEHSYAQKVCFGLVLFHYLKREFETLFIHRFSNATMPISRLPINCVHYWIIFAVSVGYFLFHPNYKQRISNPTVNILASVMIIFELLNLYTHFILRNLRPRGTKVRKIPNGGGFQFSSCANYTWEICAWIVFCFISQCVTSWIFLFVASLQMIEWAWKKHQNYIKEFEDYPKRRFVILPPFI